MSSLLTYCKCGHLLGELIDKRVSVNEDEVTSPTHNKYLLKAANNLKSIARNLLFILIIHLITAISIFILPQFLILIGYISTVLDLIMIVFVIGYCYDAGKNLSKVKINS